MRVIIHASSHPIPGLRMVDFVPSSSSEPRSQAYSAHYAASLPFLVRTCVQLSSLSPGQLHRKLGIPFFEADMEASEFLDMEVGRAWLTLLNGPLPKSESDLHGSMEIFIKSFLPLVRIVERERTNDDKSRCDLIVSIGPGADKGRKKMARPALLLEFKSPKAAFDINNHQYQLVRYLKELLGTHVSVALLPVILFNGKSFFFGFAEWVDYRELRIEVSQVQVNVIGENSKVNIVAAANLLSLLTQWEGLLRPRRILVDEKSMYKLISVIDIGATSTVYHAEQVALEDAGKPSKRTYPFSPDEEKSPVRGQPRDVDSGFEGLPTLNISKDDDEFPTEGRPSLLQQVLAFEVGVNDENAAGDIEVNRTTKTLPSKIVLTGPKPPKPMQTETTPKTPVSKEPVNIAGWTGPFEDRKEKGGIRSVALKFSHQANMLQHEVRVDNSLEEAYQVGWGMKIYELLEKGADVVKFTSSPAALLKVSKVVDLYLSIGDLHAPLRSFAFSFHSKNTREFERKHALELLRSLQSIHRAGFIHRDIRTPNILNKLGYFILCDFSYAQPKGEFHPFAGGMETASQRVLTRLAMGKAQLILDEEDDTESLYKVLLIICNGLKVPLQNNNEPDPAYCGRLHAFWWSIEEVRRFVALPDLASKTEVIIGFGTSFDNFQSSYADYIKLFEQE